MYTVYVPAPEHSAMGGIAPGSGIVGESSTDGTCSVWFEGNVYGAVNLRRWIERVECAAGRMIARYPTVARRTVPSDALTAVGTYDNETQTVWLENAAAVTTWAGEALEIGAHRAFALVQRRVMTTTEASRLGPGRWI